MIALLKIYKKTIQKDGNTYEVAGAQPYAIYKEGELQVLTESELLSTFANTGKVFVADSYTPPQQQAFCFYEVIESNTFDASRYNSCKYTLGKEILNLKLFEVIDLDETIENDKHQIGELLSKGISIPFVVSNPIIFRTSDDYLIGPLQMEFSEGIYVCKEQDFIPYYQQEIDITPLFDTYKNNLEHLFCMNQLDPENLVGWIDVANEQRVISDALKQLKDNADFAELSRKMIARLKDWYNSNKAQGSHLQERIQRAIHIMEGHTLTDDIIDLFTKLVLDLEVTKTIIEERVQQSFEAVYDTFLKNNEKLIKEKEILQKELNKLTENYLNKSQELKNIETHYSEIQ